MQESNRRAGHLHSHHDASQAHHELHGGRPTTAGSGAAQRHLRAAAARVSASSAGARECPRSRRFRVGSLRWRQSPCYAPRSYRTATIWLLQQRAAAAAAGGRVNACSHQGRQNRCRVSGVCSTCAARARRCAEPPRAPRRVCKLLRARCALLGGGAQVAGGYTRIRTGAHARGRTSARKRVRSRPKSRSSAEAA